MSEFKKAEVTRLEKHREKLTKKRERMTREIDDEIVIVDRMLIALKSRKNTNGAAGTVRKNTLSIKNAKSELPPFLYDLLGEYEEITTGELVEFVKDAYANKKLTKTYGANAITAALSTYTCFANPSRGVWKLGKSK